MCVGQYRDAILANERAVKADQTQFGIAGRRAFIPVSTIRTTSISLVGAPL
jgi:hypothetical protein